MIPVTVGLVLPEDQARRVVFAKDQPEYAPLPAIVFADGKVCTEWQLTEDERARIAAGENLRLWVWTSGGPLQPVMLQITDEVQP